MSYYGIVHLSTGIQITYVDGDDYEDIKYGNDYDPNEPKIEPKLFFYSLEEAKTFIENNIFVLAIDRDNEIPIIGRPNYNYVGYIIPKYQIEAVELR